MLFQHGLAIPREAHVAAHGSTNTEGLTLRPVGEDFLTICARLEPIETAIGAVCVECGRPMCLTMLLTDPNSKMNERKYREKKGTLPPRLTSY